MSFKSWLHFIISMFIIQSRWNGVFKSWLPFKRSHFKFCMFLLCNESFFKRLSALTLFKGFYEMGNVNLYIIIFYLKKK